MRLSIAQRAALRFCLSTALLSLGRLTSAAKGSRGLVATTFCRRKQHRKEVVHREDVAAVRWSEIERTTEERKDDGEE
jgi:hypothetical protein